MQTAMKIVKFALFFKLLPSVLENDKFMNGGGNDTLRATNMRPVAFTIMLPAVANLTSKIFERNTDLNSKADVGFRPFEEGKVFKLTLSSAKSSDLYTVTFAATEEPFTFRVKLPPLVTIRVNKSSFELPGTALRNNGN